jgi:cardiolipin synthase
VALLARLLWLLIAAASVLSAIHALLRKRDPRSALLWVLVCLALPGAGAGLYWLLGVNRIRTRARDWQPPGPRASPQGAGAPLPPHLEPYTPLRAVSDAVTRRPLVAGNRVTPLHCGEEAYPAMLAAIEGARETVHLCTYIFDSDDTGRRFAGALRAAAGRGVAVRLLVDALGERYSLRPVRRLLRGSGVRVARFLPLSLSGRGLHLNLRNHRKILVVDGTVGFTGGMNLGDRHLCARADNPGRVVDVHFRVEGPAVAHMEEAFGEDWTFAAGEALPDRPAPGPAAIPGALCRGISDGPNEDFEKLTWIVVGALNCARRRVRIMTPYFIPDRPLATAIHAAALRGVAVDIALPGKNNLPYVAWASRAYLWEFLQHGTRVWLQEPPFVHTKLLLVDDEYALVGSANLDPRSLRLNFEFNLEVYDRELAASLGRHFDDALTRSRPVTLEEVDGRPLPRKLLDATAKLFSPYL